jgi:hypothetical protein
MKRIPLQRATALKLLLFALFLCAALTRRAPRQKPALPPYWRTLPETTLRNVSLAQALAIIERQGGVSIDVAWDTFAPVGRTPTTPVEIFKRGGRLDRVLCDLIGEDSFRFRPERFLVSGDRDQIHISLAPPLSFQERIATGPRAAYSTQLLTRWTGDEVLRIYDVRDPLASLHWVAASDRINRGVMVLAFRWQPPGQRVGELPQLKPFGAYDFISPEDALDSAVLGFIPHVKEACCHHGRLFVVASPAVQRDLPALLAGLRDGPASGLLPSEAWLKPNDELVIRR